MSSFDYPTEAKNRFDILLGNLTIDQSFWRTAQSFDTIIDYFDYLEKVNDPGLRNNADLVAARVLAIYGQKFLDSAWFDDLGWWAIATHRAAGKSYFKNHKNEFDDINSFCWNGFTENAPKVWDRREPDRFNDFRPASDGGVWNVYWNDTPFDYYFTCRGNPGDPKDSAGIQNTVTNALYLIAAQLLTHTVDANRESNFLSAWAETKEFSLWWELPKEEGLNGPGLFRERVGHLYNKSEPAPGFQSDFAWTGDQGLMLGAFSVRNESLPLAQRLLKGVQSEHMTGGKTLDGHAELPSGVLRPWSTTGHPPYVGGNIDNGDYETGIAVFWHYVLYAWKNKPDFKTILEQNNYIRFVEYNADAVMKGNGWHAQDASVNLTNELAVLVAAMEMSKPS